MGAVGARGLRTPRGALLGSAAAAAVAAAGAVALTHAGAPSSTTGGPAARAYDGTLAGAPLQRAKCRQWHAAPAAQRAQAVRALSATIGGASTSGGVGTTLPAGRVAALFDRVCSTPQTAGFALYLVYARAAAFSRGVHATPITSGPAAR